MKRSRAVVLALMGALPAACEEPPACMPGDTVVCESHGASGSVDSYTSGGKGGGTVVVGRGGGGTVFIPNTGAGSAPLMYHGSGARGVSAGGRGGFGGTGAHVSAGG